MKRGIIYVMLVILLGAGCTSGQTDEVAGNTEAVTLTIEQASHLAALPLACMQTDYPNKLVHLDGLNFSRACVLYGLASQYPEYKHLLQIADEHVAHSLPNLVGDSYEGGHWLGSFALYALQLSI